MPKLCFHPLHRLLARQPALDHPQLSSYVHSGNGAGLLAALRAVLGTSGSAQAIFDRQNITCLQRRALRCELPSTCLGYVMPSTIVHAFSNAYSRRMCHICRVLLLQQRWLTHPGGSSSPEAVLAVQRQRILQRLPIFELAASAAAEGVGPTSTTASQAGDRAATIQHTAPAAAADAAASVEPLFIDLLGQRFIAPLSVPQAALPNSFLAVSDEAQPATLALLGVQRPTAAAVYRRATLPPHYTKPSTLVYEADRDAHD